MWFDSWSDIGRVLLVGTAAYVGLIVVVRLTGKRTLSQLSAFDLIVTVALGSTLATILLSSDVSWTEGIAALVLLAGLQLLVAWLVSVSAIARRIGIARPALLLYEGAVRHEELRRNRIPERELLQVIRGSGAGEVSQIGAVVLETNGTFSVIPRNAMGDRSALAPVLPS